MFQKSALQARKNKGLFRKGLTLSQTTNFGLFQTQRVCRRKFFKFDENGGKFSKSVENTVGNREIACYEKFFPFPTVFSKDSKCRHVKTRACLGNG